MNDLNNLYEIKKLDRRESSHMQPHKTTAYIAFNFVQVGNRYRIESGYYNKGGFNRVADMPLRSFPEGMGLVEVAELESNLSRNYVDVFIEGEIYRMAAGRRTSSSEV